MTINSNPDLSFLFFPLLIVVVCITYLIIGITKRNNIKKKYDAIIVYKYSYTSNFRFKLEFEGYDAGSETIFLSNVKSLEYIPEYRVAILTAHSSQTKTTRNYCILGMTESKVKEYNKDMERCKEEARNRTPKKLDTTALVDAMRIENPPKKDASVVGRAVAGGIIAGPAGAVVGALSAVDKNNRNNKK